MSWVADRTSRWRRSAPGSRLPSRSTYPWPRTVPAAVLGGAELVHLGGGESLPCPDAERLPIAASAARSGLGTTKLALPPARVHVIGDAVVHPRSRVVTTRDGRIVSESVTSAMVGKVRLDEAEMRSRPVEIDGTVAVFRSPLRSTFHTMVDDLPRAGLLIHPALVRLGPLTVLHDGPLSDVEAALLVHLSGRRVTLRQVDPGRPIHAARVVVPSYVTRPGAGAVPSWYRRWCDGVPLPTVEQAPRRLFLDSGPTTASIGNRAGLLDVLHRHRVEPIDPANYDRATFLGILRDADLVVGTADSDLCGCLFSRRAHLVELLDDITLDPAIYYLAASKGLPYDFVPSVGASNGRRSTPVVDVGWLDRLLGRITA